MSESTWPSEEAVDTSADASSSVRKLSNVTTHGSRDKTVTPYLD